MKHIEITKRFRVSGHTQKRPLVRAYVTVLKDLGLKCSAKKNEFDTLNVVIEPQKLTIGNQEHVLFAYLTDHYVPMIIQYK